MDNDLNCFILPILINFIVDEGEMPIPERPILLHESVATKVLWSQVFNPTYFGFTMPDSSSNTHIVSQNILNMHMTHLGFLLRENPAVASGEDIFRQPEHCRRVLGPAMGTDFDGETNGVNKYVTIFQPVCPYGYVSLGYIATVNPNGSDQLDCKDANEKVYCVAEKYTVQGTMKDWKKVYEGWGSMGDVTAYEAVPENNTYMISVRGFGLVEGQNQVMDEPPRFLRADMVSIVHEKPIAKMEVLDIKYEYNKKEIRNSQPTQFVSTTYRNCNHRVQGFTVEVALTETTSESFTWDVSVMVGVTISYQTAPALATVTKSGTLQITTSYGGTQIESKAEYTKASLPGTFDPM